MGEFDVIERHFRPLAGQDALELSDDCALLTPPEGQVIAISTDTMVENVHFLPTDPVNTLGRKLLRCNLSDLAAMGASPLGYTLNLTLPRGRTYSNEWFEAFCSGLAEDQKHYNIPLIGGDTTSTDGPLVLNATIYGGVKREKALRRNGAQVGDEVWVTGTIGDAALGLLALQNILPDPTGWLSTRYQLPSPRINLALHDIANAAMDISDGLVQDSAHIARASGVSLQINAHKVPTSSAADALGPQHLKRRLSGGDDYELLLCVPPHKTAALKAACAQHGVHVTHIGRVDVGQGVTVCDEKGQSLHFEKTGWQHF
ncbi:thiamine-phosphate kinase [Neokomagataea tanensis]|uniref:Thiamine-monophosphate kinase n=2 Tax=Neokomagataea TaxID=1223423 RepID=A0A4Y6VB54_9PROT|nr:thiamine-phosphate kinase [Neokomagataea tanensis]